ncbi:MAG TPA: ABC transporter permease subunit [Roseiflexaceae bacterium]|nr:ABC transporter permease subunit [Roseiflexaceae bacterium]
MATQIQALPAARPLWRRALLPLVVLGILVLTYVAARALPLPTDKFPEAWNLGLRARIDAFQDWVIGNRATHPIFVYFFQPLSLTIDTGMRWAEDVLLATPWVVLIAAFGALGYLLGGARLLLLCVIGLLLVGLFGLWDQSMQTLALMCVSVLFALLIGIPLGILAAYSDRFDRVLRPILDGMQTMPAFVYLIPVLLFFGVARVPAVIATLIYAIPPAIRLTSLGIRQAHPPAVEAARAFGSTRRQLLFKVQLPLALPALMAGVNQTIMMALGMVVIAAMIGAGGLGREVLVSLQRLKVGQALEAGLAIVILAIILDRLSDALSRIDLSTPAAARHPTPPAWLPARWQQTAAIGLGALTRLGRLPAELLATPFKSSRTRRRIERRAGLITSLLLIGALLAITSTILPTDGFPDTWRLPISGPADAAVAWMRDNLYQIGDLPIGTGPFSDSLTLYLLNPMRTLLRDALPWTVVMLALAALAYWAGGWRLALYTLAGLFLIGLLGMWELSMDTLSQVLVTMLFTIVIAVPLGVLASQNQAVHNALRPVLDFLQTIPTFVYLVPVIMLFNVGRVPGLIAALLYAIPPGIKLTELGIRQVAGETVEAAQAFGATRAQTLLNVQLPLAMPTIMVGINQMIMMVLAMVIIAGLVGGAGLGLEAVTGLARTETGRGIEAGLAIVILAIILDRITQSWAHRQP